ncbi:hypothetical protein M0R04_12050 [Candidatus Dojkabacteria bacterium]|jgi:hypothetical protein|nr:hypothetical protein [Candidatus Dojkabacteria bacterium]
MNLTDILEELANDIRKGFSIEGGVAQAKIKIEEMFLRWVGEDEKGCMDMNCNCVFERNKIKQEIRNRVKDNNGNK